jgi:hypothetical protein
MLEIPKIPPRNPQDSEPAVLDARDSLADLQDCIKGWLAMTIRAWLPAPLTLLVGLVIGSSIRSQ